MDVTVILFLSSGLFLGWSLGANDAANVFGTAVGTRMVRFGTAAAICSVFVILGAVLGGSGAAHTLGKLGATRFLHSCFQVEEPEADDGWVHVIYHLKHAARKVFGDPRFQEILVHFGTGIYVLKSYIGKVI